VIVATVRALKLHGGADKTQLATEDTAALRRGIPNLLRHIENITQVYGLPAVVALNRFTSDTAAELALVQEACAAYGAEVALSEVWEKGSRGGMELACGVLRSLERENHFRFAYDAALPIRDKLLALTQRVYGGRNVAYTEEADREINRLTELGFGGLPVCVAKTQYSLSDDPTKLGAPQDFILTVRKVKVSAGAGFIVALTGDILTMPGLPKPPAAEAPTPPAEVTPASTEAPAPAEPPIPDWMADQPAPAFLDAEQQALFLRAYSAASFLMGCSTSGVDSYPLDGGDPPELGDYETVTLDSGWTYLVAQGRYARWEDFQAMLDGIFTPAYQEELLWTENMDGERFPIFTADGEGRTCFLELERGSSLEYGWADVPDTYELVSQSEDAVEFYLVGHYADLTVQPDETGARPLSTERWPIRMERTAGGWRVSEFHVPY